MIELNKIYNESCTDTMLNIPDGFIDLTITSPPYDNQRKYASEFPFESIVRELYRVTKPGGVVVWVVGDSVIACSETGTSFKQALFFKEVGFNLHDTMIYKKRNPVPQLKTKRYTGSFEYMFVFSKGIPKTCNYLMEDCLNPGREHSGNRNSASATDSADRQNKLPRAVKKTKIRSNVWEYAVGINKSCTDEFGSMHPAIFPEQLAADHILSWTNCGDVVYDPFIGSGTVAKECILLDRNYIGSEISKEYYEIAEGRVSSLIKK